MVKGLSMESQNNRMCKTESFFSDPIVGCNPHYVYDDDCLNELFTTFDPPMESLEEDGLASYWASNLEPIPSEDFKQAMPPPGSQIVGGSNYGPYADLPFEYPLQGFQQKYYYLNHDEEMYKNYQSVNLSQLKQEPTSVAFEAPSPNSVLESRTSSSSNKGVSFGTEVSIPVRTRTKRVRPTANPWLRVPFVVLPKKGKKRKTTTRVPVTMETGIKKCAHCEITKTPQWREGPMGPKTLCNACGVRYRSGRLYPEYRPAASPTFVPALHSNSHRKVIEMRQKAVI